MMYHMGYHLELILSSIAYVGKRGAMELVLLYYSCEVFREKQKLYPKCPVEK